MYSPSKAISPSHTYIHKIVPYIVACISPRKGHVLSFQSNQPGMYPSHAHIHMNKPFDVRSCIALLYKTAIPGATLKTPGQEQIQPSSLLGLLSHRILKPTEVFLLYICVLTTLSNYAGGLGCEADCQFMVANTLTVTCTQSACAAGAGYSN